VFIIAFFTSKLLQSTLITGAMQFVVHEAQEIISPAVAISSSFTPKTIVVAPSVPGPLDASAVLLGLAGADKITFLAPALICALALAGSLNTPVHSKTISTPNSFHGKFSGSRIERNLIWFWPIFKLSSSKSTFCSNSP
jgi:hypothetical protein